MNTSESADELIKICIDGVDRILRISGVGAKNIAMMLIAMSKEMKQTRGKTRLTNMLKTGKPLDIFTIRAEDLKKFSQEAKKYGILYCALANKKNTKIDGMVDIMVREEDGAKLNRISERFNFKDLATIKEEYEKSKQERVSAKDIENAKSKDEQFIDDIMPKEKEEQKDIPSNNTKETEEKNQSEISSNIKSKDKVESSKDDKKSVRKELKEIEQELKSKEERNIETQDLQNNNTRKNDKTGKRYKEKNKGKRFKEPKHLDNTPKSKKKKSKGRSK